MPTLIEWPGRLAPRTSDFPGGTVDLFATFLELAGVAVPADRPLDGVSLVPLLEGEMHQRPTPLGFWHHEGIAGRLMWSDKILQELQAVLEAGGQGEINQGTLYGPDHDYRSLEQSPGHSVWLDPPRKLHELAGGDYLLSNLADDPGERNNVIADHPDRAERMKQQLRAWRASCLHSLRGGDY